MRYIFTILILLILSPIVIAQKNNDFIYERYASRTDLTVTQVIDFPVDSHLFVNIIMLQADNKTAWKKLKQEFKSEPQKKDYKKILRRNSPMEISIQFRNHDDPTKSAPTPIKGELYDLKSCIVATIYSMQSIWLFYYDTTAEANKIIDWLIQKKYNK